MRVLSARRGLPPHKDKLTQWCCSPDGKGVRWMSMFESMCEANELPNKAEKRLPKQRRVLECGIRMKTLGGVPKQRRQGPLTNGSWKEEDKATTRPLPNMPCASSMQGRISSLLKRREHRAGVDCFILRRGRRHLILAKDRRNSNRV